VNEVIGETGIQLGAVLVPGQAEGGVAFATLGDLLFLGEGQVSVRLIFVTHQVPDLHSVLGGHTNPLQLVVEKDLVHFALGINGADGFLEVSHIPEVKDLILATSGQVLGVGGDSDGVDLTIMGLEGVSDLEISVPDLESSVPAHRGEVGVEGALGLGLQLGGISHLRHPVLMIVSFRGVLTVSQGVPELDFLISARGNDLTVVRGEGYSEYFLLVASELTDSLAGLDVPETEGLVPGRGDAVVTIQGEAEIRDEMVVAGELLGGHTHDVFLRFVKQLPGHEALVTRTRDQHGGILTVDGAGGGLETGHPVAVAS
jgi:hypothetical protein